jgi:hypothetical protein
MAGGAQRPRLLTGEPVEGIWYDRTLARNLRLRRKTPEPGQVEIRPVVLSQLPCWKHLTPDAYRTRVAGLIGQIDATAAAERAKKGMEPLGAEKILAQGPVCRERAPLVAASDVAQAELWPHDSSAVSASLSEVRKVRIPWASDSMFGEPARDSLIVTAPANFIERAVEVVDGERKYIVDKSIEDAHVLVRDKTGHNSLVPIHRLLPTHPVAHLDE